MGDEDAVSAWAIGLIYYAGVMLMMVGIFQAMQGVAALVNDKFYVAPTGYAFEIGVTGWGWIHLLLGLLVAVAGFCLLFGQLWARIVGIAAAVLSAISNFFFIPYYPLWAVLIIVLDLAVIWALAFHGRAAAPFDDMAATMRQATTAQPDAAPPAEPQPPSP